MSAFTETINGLTPEMIDAGEALVIKLDDMGFEVNAALWFFDPGGREWQLLIASPLVKAGGKRAVYNPVRRALGQLGPEASAVSFSVVQALDADAALIRAMRPAWRIGPITQIRFKTLTVNGQYIEDAVVYRLI